MRKLLVALICTLFVVSCQNEDPGQQLKYLDGYWEIKKVEVSKDSVKEYQFNANVDFFEIENMKGYRKKVRPQFNGTFQVTGDVEKLEVKIEDKHLYLYYSTPYDSWREKVLRIEEDLLEIENEQGLIYHYTRFIPLSIKNNEEE